MKKTKVLLTTLLAGAVVLSGCSNEKKEGSNNNSNSTQQTQNTNTQTNQNKTENNEKVYKLNEEWEVPGQWKIKVTSVKTTDERVTNNSTPVEQPVEQVVLVSYSYENTGFKGKTGTEELGVMPLRVIDGAKKVVTLYPLESQSISGLAPVGAIQNGTIAFGLTTKSKTIKVLFEQTDSSGKLRKATFEVPVQS